jgi:hypothetical protein
MLKGIDAPDAGLEADWTDYGLMMVRLLTRGFVPILRR